MTDSCATGIAGLISQGDEWKIASITAFYSAKLNSAQRNYPVHEIEMLTSVETMLRYKDILQGVHFKWITDHKGLIHLLNQKNLSGCQAQWMEKITSFVFEVIYVAGSENVVANSLSRMYSDDSETTVWSRTEFTYHDVTNDDSPSFIRDSSLSAMTQKPGKATNNAETGRPETSREFTTRMCDHFVLQGPGERKVGGNDTNLPTSLNLLDTLPNSVNTDSILDTSLLDIVSASDLGIDLIKELQGQYINDPVFKEILNRPKEFRNFELDNNLVYLKEFDKKILCIPHILIKG